MSTTRGLTVDEYEIRITPDSVKVGFSWEARRAGVDGHVFANGWDETKKAAKREARRSCAHQMIVDATPWETFKP